MNGKEDAENLVKSLYAYRDNFVENVGLEHILEKPTLVKAEMDKTMQLMKDCESSCPKTTFMLLCGKVLNIMPEYNKECEDILSKVVKRDPSLIEAWNMLGETFWKKGNIPAAKDCFEGALKRTKNKVSLRSLSMVLRQMKPLKLGDEQKNVIQSVEHAKAAVDLDKTDGTSWYVLGNAYLSLFFVTEQNPKVLMLSLDAYTKAEEVDKSSKHNPDLHFNRAMACRYEQAYKLALEGLKKSLTLDPTWPEPKLKTDEIYNYLDRVSELVEKKGKLKAKRIQGLIKTIKDKDLGPYAGGSYTSNGKTISLELTALADLKEGANPEKVLLGRVVCNLAGVTLVPFTIAMVDSASNCCSVTIYNLSQGRGMIIGDSVAIPEPFVTHHDIEWETKDGKKKHWKFTNIRVNHPVALVVNGKKLTAAHCSYTRASMEPSH